jgi:hypothetical protein
MQLQIELINLNDAEEHQIEHSHWSFFGSYMQQTPNAVLSINKLLNSYYFDNIIEFGTHDAGLSTLLSIYSFLSKNKATSSNPNEPCLYKNNRISKIPCNFWTFDNVIRDETQTKFIQLLGANVNIVDILNDNDTIEKIRNLISSSSRCLVLCDNGDKIKEFELYANHLPKGSFIMVHDYAYDEKTFEDIQNKKIWYCLESDNERLSKYMTQYNIEQVYRETFDNSVWFCGIKK